MTFCVVRLRTIISIMTFPILVLFLAIALFFVTSPVNVLNFLLLIVVFGITAPFLYVFVTRRITVTEDGLEYRTMFKRKFWKWNDIRFIGVDLHTTRLNGTPLLICFTKDYDSEMTDAVACDNAFLRVYYRKKLVDEISKYYGGEIVGLQIAEELLIKKVIK